MVMGAKWSTSFSPDYAVVPGQHLATALATKGMSQAELAVRIGRPHKTINEIVKGKAAITPDTALQLERALGISAKTWNGLEANYQLQLAEQRDRARLEEYANWAERIPIAELRKRGQIPETDSKVDLVRRCLEFFGIDSPESLAASSTVASFRKSPAFEPDDLAMCTWLRLGELEAERTECEPYDRNQFRSLLDKLRALTRESDLQRIKKALQDECRKCGVAVCFTTELRHTHVSGAARWITPDKAMIQLSCRYKSDDHFWFTFFHECAHILLHGKKEGFLEGRETSSQEEEEANEFAANHLIPRQAISSLMREKPLSEERLVRFAEQIGIAPGIVVGQLQKRKRLVPATPLNKLKRFLFDLAAI
jgi:HTH-type transcriptional regulator/antitoxin HigA